MSPRTSSIVVAVLGTALVALAIFTVVQMNSLDSKINDLEDSTATLESSTTSGGENTASEIKGLSAELKKLRACLPEVQNEINGLSVEIEETYAYIENNSQVSSYCQPVVYPEISTAGE